MRRFRLALVALLTCLFLVNKAFLRKAITFLLCGLLSFNLTAYYGFLGRGEVATAAAPPSMSIVPSKLPHLTPVSGVSQAVEKELTLAANPSPVSLEGKWQSEWGVVEFNANLTGRWNQGGGIGQITSGSYDPKTRKLVFQYYQSWNDMDGTATLGLSENGNRLAGTWIQQRRGSNRIGSGDSGSWIMTRDASNEIAKPNKEETLPEPGDIVIYRASNGDITHSGVITAVRPDGAVTQIKSKWGGQGLYLHDPNDSTYGKSWTVWRAKRKDGSRNNLLTVRPTQKFPLNLANGYYTDKDRLITTFLTGYAEEGDAEGIKNYIQTHKGKSPIVELQPPTTNYNCHGFTFTGGRQSVPPTQVQYILNDNGYFQIKALDSDRNPH